MITKSLKLILEGEIFKKTSVNTVSFNVLFVKVYLKIHIYETKYSLKDISKRIHTSFYNILVCKFDAQICIMKMSIDATMF